MAWLEPWMVEVAYREGCFPMGLEDGTIGWYQPRKRAVFFPGEFRVTRSLRRSAKKYRITFDMAFEEVMRCCANREEGTWITEDFFRVYGELFRDGKAHSAEVWWEEKLVGGVYGVRLGNAFMAESMFHTMTDAGKVALWKLIEKLTREGVELVDAQFVTPHLLFLGAKEISHEEYLQRLHSALDKSAVS
ncbi:MAG TPA: leucyl/phenylalanyl-tRNA--protein transferase [Fimbriimonadales bacterium]|nr:leucyl/phenylalanyl-tRNA--protein transferase [Fimbriimonadales bacterium]